MSSPAVRARNLLRARQRATPHVPGRRPSLFLQRKGDQWGVVMLHGPAGEMDWMLPAEARSYAAAIVRMANLASRPGELPAEDCG